MNAVASVTGVLFRLVVDRVNLHVAGDTLIKIKLFRSSHGTKLDDI